MSVLFTKEHTEQLEKQETFVAKEQARTRVMDMDGLLVNGDWQVKSEFSTAIISNFWRERIQISDLAETQRYAETIEGKEASVWVTSGMDWPDFDTMKDFAFTHLDMVKHVQTHGKDSINSYFAK